MDTSRRTPNSRNPLTACHALDELLPETVDELQRRMHERAWPAGSTIIRQGESGDSVMVVVSGTARIEVHDGAGPAHRIADCGPGDMVGEMALVTRQPRTADVVAESEVVAYVLAAADFEAIAADFPDIGVVLTNLVADRLGGNESDGLSGKVVDAYRILRRAGRGGMAIVYEGVETETGRRVALKMMSHRLIYERGALARFQREADILEQLDHPNIARIYRRFRAFRTFFIAMEYCEGPTLEAHLAATGPLPESEVRALVGQLASALVCLGPRGIVHRDLKPANVLVTPGGILKLTDFGLARPIDATPITAVTERRTILGTPHYMAPETLTGAEAGAEADVYALGCVALEALLGHCPFQQASYSDLLEAKRNFKLPAAAEIGGGVGPEMHAFLAAALDGNAATRLRDLGPIAGWSAPIGA